ncbi:MAG: hypothetical protein ACHQK8_00040 [Bacteroidia bacterium]
MIKKIILTLILFILYGSVGYFSSGFDDEFFTIRLIEKLGFGAVSFLQTTDIHPPGSYIIDSLLFAAFGKWELVRLVISLITATSLMYAINAIEKRNGKFAGLVAFILLGLNPAILLWCTSIRWYAFFVPVLIWLSIVPEKQDWKYWGKCFGGLLCLAYFGYAFLVIVLPVVILYWMKSDEENSKKIKGILFFGLLFLILYSYQFFIFYNVHYKNKDTQISSLLKSIYGIYTSQFSNQGVIPVSIPGIISSIGTIGIIIAILYSDLKSNLKNNYFAVYSVATVFTLVTGVASKIRNLVIISPWQALWIATAKIEAPQKKFFILFLSFLAIGNLWGDLNVVTHHNTTKSNFDLQVQPVLDDLKIEKLKSKNDLIVLCHDPKLTWHLNHNGFTVVGPYSHSVLTPELFRSKHRCVVILKTWTGLKPEQLKIMYKELQLLKYESSTSLNLGRDDFYTFKNKLNSLYPEYMVEVTRFYEVENLEAVKSWQPIKATLFGY